MTIDRQHIREVALGAVREVILEEEEDAAFPGAAQEFLVSDNVQIGGLPVRLGKWAGMVLFYCPTGCPFNSVRFAELEKHFQSDHAEPAAVATRESNILGADGRRLITEG